MNELLHRPDLCNLLIRGGETVHSSYMPFSECSEFSYLKSFIELPVFTSWTRGEIPVSAHYSEVGLLAC